MSLFDIKGHMDRIAMACHHCLKREVTRRESWGDARLDTKHPSQGPKGGNMRALWGVMVGIDVSRCLISLS